MVPNTAEPPRGGEEAVADRNSPKLFDAVLGLSMLIWMSVAASLGSVGFIINGMISELGITSPSLKGLLASSSLIGMFIGALTSGFIGDVFGRRRSAILFGLIHGVAGVSAMLVKDPYWFSLWRIFAGFGLGGTLPVVASLVSEYSWPVNRGRRISLLESSWAYGWLIPVLTAYFCLKWIGWMMYGVITALIALLLVLPVLILPESPRYLLLRGKDEEARRLADKYGIPLPSIKGVGTPWHRLVARLFSRDYLPVTLGLWLTWFTITMGYYGLFIWFPRLLAVHGKEIGFTALSEYLAGHRLEYLVIITLAQIPGYYSAAYLVDVIGHKKTLGAYLALTGVSAYFLATASTVPLFLALGITLAFFDLGSWAALYTYTPEQYPTSIRVAGTAWASTIGRLGGILGPYIVPYLGSWEIVFIIFATIHLVGVIGVIPGRELMRKEMVE